jgi:hypothetical protein
MKWPSLFGYVVKTKLMGIGLEEAEKSQIEK